MALHSLDVEQLRRLSQRTPAAHFEAPLGLPFETLPRYTPVDVAPSLSELPAPVSPRPYDDTLRKREFIASLRSPAPTALTVSAQLPPRLGLEITPLNFAQRQLPPPIPPPPPPAAAAAASTSTATPPTPYLAIPATAVPATAIPATAVPVALYTRPQPPAPRPWPQSPAAAASASTSASAFAAATAAAAAPAAFGGGGLSVDERVQRILAAVEERERLLFEAEQPAVAPRYVPPPQAAPLPGAQPAQAAVHEPSPSPSPSPSPPPPRLPTPPEPSPSPQVRAETPAQREQPAREAAGNTVVIPAGLPGQPLGLEFAQELPLILRAVRPGSPADTSGAGAYAGRTLLSIDGAAVQTVEDVRRAGGSGVGVVVLAFSEEAAVPLGGGGPQQRRTYFAPVPETEESEAASGLRLLEAAEESARLRVVDGESIAFMSLLGSSCAPASPAPAVVEADNPIAHLVDSDPSRWVRLQRGDEIVWVKR